MNPIQAFRKIMHYLEVQPELDDFDVIHKSIEKDSIFKGTNLWVLMFAIVIASVGLNVNSTAVIIGAMLISPLMGPINGMGYSLATYDFDLFRRALKNFGFAVGVSLFASTIYFFISPLSNAHSELLARTSPTIYDVIIAAVGGLSGIVAISTRQKGNVIPGVAIATALMPPLCTAGYGLATLQLNFLLGALYLFTINTVFIAMSAVAMSQILKFPIRSNVAPARKKSINRWITVVILVVMLPSIYFGYGLVLDDRFSASAELYAQKVSYVDGSFLLKHEIKPVTGKITLVYGGDMLSDDSKRFIRQVANEFELKNATIDIVEGNNSSELHQKNSELSILREELSKLKLDLNTKEALLDSLNKDSLRGKFLLGELNVLFPEILACTYANTTAYHLADSTPEHVAVVLIQLKEELPKDDMEKIDDWLMVRLKTSQLKTFYEMPR